MDTNIGIPKPMNWTGNVAENWRRWEQRFDLYRLASGASEKSSKTQVALLLHIMGEECLDIFNSFVFAKADDKDKI